MELSLDNARLRELVPNVIHEVRGETLLIDKLRPWLESAAMWLDENIIGADYELPGNLYTLAEKIAVFKAFGEAVPSLDVTLSPAGFAVINTDGRVPASKERIERLRSTLDTYVDANVEVLLSRLLAISEWRDTAMGRWWLGTFIPTLKYSFSLRGQNGLLDTYRRMRGIAVRFEQEIAESYTGYSVLEFLHSEQDTETAYGRLIEMLRSAELSYITLRMREHKKTCSDDREIWTLIRPIINSLHLYPALYQIWHEGMGYLFDVEPFKNDVKGGYYF